MPSESSTQTNLVELESVKQLVQLPILSNFFKLDVVLLKAVERKLRFVVNEDLQRLQSNQLSS